MISDSLENAPAYFGLCPRIATALRFLQSQRDLSVGRHDIDGDRIFALVQEYQTKPREQCFWEAHRRYSDVQFIEHGIEAMGWSPIQSMKVKKDYDAEKDVLVLEGSGQMIEVPARHFAIFQPHDAHMPCLAVDKPLLVRKIVVKVAVE